MEAPQNTFLGTWKFPPYQITLYATEEGLEADVKPSKGPPLRFKGEQMTCGVRGDLPQQDLIDKIHALGIEKIAVFAFPKETPTELWVFEATKMAGLEIRQGKEYLVRPDLSIFLSKESFWMCFFFCKKC